MKISGKILKISGNKACQNMGVKLNFYSNSIDLLWFLNENFVFQLLCNLGRVPNPQKSCGRSIFLLHMFFHDSKSSFTKYDLSIICCCVMMIHDLSYWNTPGVFYQKMSTHPISCFILMKPHNVFIRHQNDWGIRAAVWYLL